RPARSLACSIHSGSPTCCGRAWSAPGSGCSSRRREASRRRSPRMASTTSWRSRISVAARRAASVTSVDPRRGFQYRRARMRRVSAGVLVAVLIVAAGCAGKKKVIPPEKLWSQADEAYNDEAYEYAVDRYKLFLDQHPFDPRAEEAELRIAESYYL